jgi:hypothetical protein
MIQLFAMVMLALFVQAPAVPDPAMTGTITGRIVSQLGQPIANADVQAVKVGYRDGQRVFVAVRSAITNDLGEYRLFWLPPGTYYVNVLAAGVRPFVVNANAAPGLVQFAVDTEYVAKRPPLGRIGDRELDVPVYFPGTPDGQRAVPIEVQSRDEIRGIDIVAAPVTTPRVRGAVINDVTGQPEAGVQVRMISSNPVSGSPTAGYSAPVDPRNGVFEIPKVVPGTYVLLALAQNRLLARRDVEVLFADVDVSLRTRREFTLSGRLLYDGPVAGANASPIVVALQPYPPLPPALINSNVTRALQNAATSPVAADGSFPLRQIPAGDYRLVIAQGIPAETYLKSARIGMTDALNTPIHVEQQTQDLLEIVLGTRPGRISGLVPSGAATIVLVPAEHRSFRTDLFQVTTSEANGRFEFVRIPPGAYTVFAWERVEDGAWQDPLFLSALEGLGRAVRVDEGAGSTLEITTVSK